MRHGGFDNEEMTSEKEQGETSNDNSPSELEISGVTALQARQEIEQSNKSVVRDGISQYWCNSCAY